MKPIPYGKHQITEEDIQAVVKTLKADFLTQGPKVQEFENCFANYVGAQYAVAVSSGTAALHLASLALGLTAGQKVIVPSMTFVASANCVRFCGAEVVFADIDATTYLLDVNSVAQILSTAVANEFAGIVAVDFAGRATQLEQLKQLAKQYNLWLIEDACHAVGGYFIDSKGIKQICGNAVYADIGIFSFHPVKHIATGEGAMLTTNNQALYTQLCALRCHGISKNPASFSNPIALAGGRDNYPAWYMEMHLLGYNYRISDINCALGISQLSQITNNLAKRQQIAQKYAQAFQNKSYILGQSGWQIGHAYHLYVIEVENRLDLYYHLVQRGIFSQVHYIPCHLMPYYQQLGSKVGDCPQAERYYQRCLSLPIYPSLTDEEQDWVIHSIRSFYEK